MIHVYKYFFIQVAWYRIFARKSSGSNVKVRINDYTLPGTGEEVWRIYISKDCYFVIMTGINKEND